MVTKLALMLRPGTSLMADTLILHQNEFYKHLTVYMLQTICGMILVAAPFAAVFFYKDFKAGLIKIALYSASFHFFISIITQAFHIFSYLIIVSANVVFAAALLAIAFRRANLRAKSLFNISPAQSSLKILVKNNWIFFIALAIIFLQLFSVHQSYTGTAQTFRGQVQVSNNSYPYPFISDEWVTVSLVDYSIAHQALPLVNPLDHNAPFPNILFAFSSVLAEIFLISGLNPLTHYWILAIFFGLAVCASLYSLLKTYGINQYLAAAGLLCVPYIVNSGNLPALWALLPVTIGIILFCWQLISQKSGYYRSAGLYAILVLIVYPPMVVFVIPALWAGLFGQRIDPGKDAGKGSAGFTKRAFFKYFMPLAICLGVFTLFYPILARFRLTIPEIFGKYLIRPNLDPGIVSYAVWHVLPRGVIFLALAGIYRIIKKRFYELAAVLAVGLAYWCVYPFIDKVFIIEYPRIVFITSLFLIIAAGIGGEWLAEVAAKKISRPNLPGKYIALGAGLFAIFLSMALLPSYTSGSPWNKLTLNFKDGAGRYQKFTPAAPVNRYLVQDDLRLFQGIRGINFIAPPWKGLVIGVATGNFPLESKASTITNKFFPYADFIKLDCQGKLQAAKEYYLSYVYSDQFTCPQFEEIGSSLEGLYLYRLLGLAS